MKKNWMLLVLGGVVLFCFILGTSYAWYNLFHEEVDLTANLEIKINDKGEGVTIVDALPVSDEEGKKVKPYVFQVKNNGNVAGNYKLLIQETPFNKIKDGCTKATLLKRSQLRYQLLMNGKELEVDNLDKIKNNTLDLRTIEVNTANNYELRVWVPESVEKTDWQNKHYHYSVVILPFAKEEIK